MATAQAPELAPEETFPRAKGGRMLKQQLHKTNIFKPVDAQIFFFLRNDEDMFSLVLNY